jgi:Domain of unknown function (DUF4340)
MNFRTTYVLLGAVVLALGGLGLYVIFSKDEKPGPSVEGYLLKSLRAADINVANVTSIEISRPGQTPDKIAFAHEGKSWQMVAPTKLRVDSAVVDQLISGLLNSKIEKSADIGLVGAHGLENPPVTVTINAVKADINFTPISESISLGNVTIGGDRAVVYVVTSDRPDKPQAARKSDFNALFKSEAPKGATHAGQLVKGVTDFRPLKMLGDGVLDPTSQVRSMAVRAGKDEIALAREPGGSWRFRIPADYGEAASDGGDPFTGPKDSGGINNVGALLNTIMSIQPADRKAIIEDAKDLAKYGLDPAKNNPLQIDFSRDDGVKESLYIGGPIKTEGQPEKYYAHHEADSAIAEVPAEPIKKVLAVLANKNLLRDRTVLRVTPARVDAIDIETNGEKIELRRVGMGWQVYDAEGKGRPVKLTAVTDLLTRLTVRQLASSFPNPDVPEDKRGFAKPAAEIRLWENGIVPVEKSDPKVKPKVAPNPTVKLQFGHKDVGDVVFARRMVGDAKADFFIPLDVFQLASRSRMEYLDAPLKPFGADAVLKLSFTVGKDTYELQRGDDGKPAAQATWKINSPERLKGRAADPFKVADLINQLALIRATRVASDKVTDDVLNRLEVNPAAPRMKVTATVKDSGERVFLFGGDAGTAKKTVYLRPADQDLVFEVDRSAFDHFQKADVQDTVVHRIDKAKVKAVKITGWQEVLGTPTTLEIERKDGKWALKSGGMFELDPAKVDAFLNDLTTPRADAFVVLKEGPKPEHNLDVAKNAMAIEMILDAGDPVRMLISSPNKDGKVFATSSALAGDVFTMTDKFAAIRAKPAALKKD